MSIGGPDYIGYRGELLSKLILTREPEAIVTEVGATRGTKLDFIVQLPSKDGASLAVLGVNVKSTRESFKDSHDATRYLNRAFKQREQIRFLFPAILLLVSVNNDEAYYDWIMRPGYSTDRRSVLVPQHQWEAQKVGKDTIAIIYSELSIWTQSASHDIVQSPKD